MTFSEEQNRIIDERLNKFGESLLDRMNESISGLAKRLVTKEFPTIITTHLPQVVEDSVSKHLQGFQPKIKEELDSFLEALAKEAGAEEVGESNDRDRDAIELRRQLAEQSKVLEKFKNDLTEQQKRAEAAERARLDMAEQQRLASMETAAIDRIKGVRNPKQFLTLLKSDGLLIEHDGQYFVKAQGDYGLEENMPIDKAVPTLLRSDVYSHFEEVRPGTGTGASPAGATNASRNGKYFNPNRETNIEALYAAMQDPAKRDEVLKEAQNVIAS